MSEKKIEMQKLIDCYELSEKIDLTKKLKHDLEFDIEENQKKSDMAKKRYFREKTVILFAILLLVCLIPLAFKQTVLMLLAVPVALMGTFFIKYYYEKKCVPVYTKIYLSFIKEQGERYESIEKQEKIEKEQKEILMYEIDERDRHQFPIKVMYQLIAEEKADSVESAAKTYRHTINLLQKKENLNSFEKFVLENSCSK